MAYESGSFDAAIAAAAGDDAALRAELRRSFGESMTEQNDLLHRARCDGNWHLAAARLHRLALSFHFSQLADLANEALAGAPGDPVILRRIDAFCQDFSSAS